MKIMFVRRDIEFMQNRLYSSYKSDASECTITTRRSVQDDLTRVEYDDENSTRESRLYTYNCNRCYCH